MDEVPTVLDLTLSIGFCRSVFYMEDLALQDQWSKILTGNCFPCFLHIFPRCDEGRGTSLENYLEPWQLSLNAGLKHLFLPGIHSSCICRKEFRGWLLRE
ncbi:hypothetical protein SCA6_013770 [Theobroma cacao]